MKKIDSKKFLHIALIIIILICLYAIIAQLGPKPGSREGQATSTSQEMTPSALTPEESAQKTLSTGVFMQQQPQPLSKEEAASKAASVKAFRDNSRP
ncbi:MAG: hypothetical protein JWO73_449 [Candidatus Taylorbacteria bacterium]|nr:hypothetical protein [Candidatus Taylorbacteria bacterium]